MLRDSKRAGYQRLTTYIYEYRQYEVDPKPVKEKPPPSRKAHDHSSPHDNTPMPSGNSGNSGLAQSVTPSRPSRPMPSFFPIQANKKNLLF